MPFKLSFLLCLIAFFHLANAQAKEIPPIDLIELLGEFNEDETLTLEDAMSEVETSKPERTKQIEDTKYIKDAGATHEDSI